MNTENKLRKKNGKKSSAIQDSHLGALLEEQPEAEPMQTEVATTGRFDSLRTALLQCVQVRDQETLGALLRNDDEDLIANTVTDLPAAPLEQFVGLLIDRLTNDPSLARQAVRWLKQTVKANAATLHALPETLGALRGIHAFIRKKEQMLPTVVRMKGKIAFALEQRARKRVGQKEALDLASMKPLLKINGGQIEEPQLEDGLEQEDIENEEADEGEIDDELDDELDQDERLYQEAYENEEIDEALEDEDDEMGQGDEDEL